MIQRQGWYRDTNKCKERAGYRDMVENISRIGDRGENDTKTGLDTWVAVSMNRIKNKTGRVKRAGLETKVRHRARLDS